MLSPNDPIQLRRLSLKLGLSNGLLIGLALGLGTWTSDAIALSAAHVQQVYPALFLGLLTLLLLGGLAGWLAAWLGSALGGGLVWLLAASLMTWTVGHLPYEGRSLTAWLADRRFWGLAIYPFSPAAQARLVMAGFFVVLLLGILGLIQDYRLESVRAEVSADGRLSTHAWFSLFLPLPLVFFAGLAADNLVNNPLRSALRSVHEVIRTGRTYPGDLFKLSLERGLNYNALAGIRDQMSANYSLSVGEVKLGPSSTVVVTAHFDNGAWINCRVIADQLFHCYDASPPYQRGFPALLTTGETPEDCRECFIQVSDEQLAWLRAQAEHFAGPPRVARLAQWGSYVLMQAQSPADGRTINCLLHGISPVRLDRCSQSRGPGALEVPGP